MKVISSNSREAKRLRWLKEFRKFLSLEIFRISDAYKTMSTEEIIIEENKILDEDNSWRKIPSPD